MRGHATSGGRVSGSLMANRSSMRITLDMQPPCSWCGSLPQMPAAGPRYVPWYPSSQRFSRPVLRYNTHKTVTLVRTNNNKTKTRGIGWSELNFFLPTGEAGIAGKAGISRPCDAYHVAHLKRRERRKKKVLKYVDFLFL
mmetsp:Transcript_7018/g.10263  ORF Transcript_7018/g.10263 Transcript_7018/m.10263 type:complete len:140 (+) Transcript_7018:649-1068(+)